MGVWLVSNEEGRLLGCRVIVVSLCCQCGYILVVVSQVAVSAKGVIRLVMSMIENKTLIIGKNSPPM